MSPSFARTTAGTLPKCGNGRVSDAVTSELGDRQSSHPVKTRLQYYGKSLEALPGVAYPGFRDNRSTLNTKTGFKKRTFPSDFGPFSRFENLGVPSERLGKP